MVRLKDLKDFPGASIALSGTVVIGTVLVYSAAFKGSVKRTVCGLALIGVASYFITRFS